MSDEANQSNFQAAIVQNATGDNIIQLTLGHGPAQFTFLIPPEGGEQIGAALVQISQRAKSGIILPKNGEVMSDADIVDIQKKLKGE